MSTGNYDGSIRINTQVDGSGVKSGVKDINASLGSLMSSLKGVAGAVGIAFGVSELIKFGKEAIGVASDLNEVQNVVDTAFGNMAYMANDFAKTALDKFGMSELAAKQTSSTFMAMSAGMGIVGKAGADMSLSLTGLTGDMSSFYNVSQDIASTALKSIYTGETETLKQFGVVMTQANLQQYAYSKGINQSVDTMSQAQQVMLRYQYVTQQLSLAQGDFTKTSGSWANQTRVLSERWKEFTGIIGNGLIQILTPALQALNETLSAMISLAQSAGSALSSAFGLQAQQQSGAVQATQKNAAAQKALAAAADSTASSTKKAGTEAKKSAASFDEFHILSKSTSSDSGAAGTTSTVAQTSAGTKTSSNATNAAKVIKDALKSVSDYLKRYEPSISAWGDAFEKIKKPASDALKSVGNSLKTLWDGTLKPFGSYIGTDFLPSIANGFSDTFAPIFADVMPVLLGEFSKDFEFACQQIDKSVHDIYQPALEFMKEAAQDVFGGIKKSWDEHGAGILSAFQTFKDGVRDAWNNLYDNIIKPVADNIGQTVSSLWDKHLKPLWDNISDFVGSLIEFIMTVWNQYLLPAVNWIVKEFGPPISYIIGIIGDEFSTIFGVIADVIGGFLEQLSGLMDFLTGVFTGNWDKAWKGLQKMAKGSWDMIVGVIKGAINRIIDALNALWGGVYFIVRHVVDAVGDVAGALGSLFGQDWSFSMPAEIPKIPHLANGAVISPNQQFLALLGDQTHGNNIETPESLLRQIVREEGGGANASILREILAAVKAGRTISVDGIPLAQTVARYTSMLGYQT